MRLILITLQKTIDYAQNLLEQGDLIDAKLILDQTAKQIDSNRYKQSDKEHLTHLRILRQKITDLRAAIFALRKKTAKKGPNLDEISST
jgi:signal transduction histidine kinase